MKKRLLGCIAFMVLTLSIMLSTSYWFAQSADASAPEVQWSQTYAGDSASSVIQTSDQGYLIVTSPEISSPDTVLELIKADSAGNQVWTRTYPGFPSGVLAVQTADGGYAIAGTVTVENRNQFFLAKLDSSGATAWNNTYGGMNNDAVSNLIITSDGGYLIAGYYNPPSDSPSYALLVKTDSQGNLTWYRIFDSWQLYGADVVCQAPDGGYVFSSFTDMYACLVEVNSQGDTQDSMTLDTIFENVYSPNVPAIVVNSDGAYVIAGHYIGLNNTTYDAIWLAKIAPLSSSPTPTPSLTPTPSPTSSPTATPTGTSPSATPIP